MAGHFYLHPFHFTVQTDRQTELSFSSVCRVYHLAARQQKPADRCTVVSYLTWLFVIIQNLLVPLPSN